MNITFAQFMIYLVALISLVGTFAWLYVEFGPDENIIAGLWTRYWTRRRIRQTEKLIQECTDRGWVLMDRSQVATLRAILWAEEARIRRLGGGNASKFRQPRKTLRRIVQRLEKAMATAQTQKPEVV